MAKSEVPFATLKERHAELVKSRAEIESSRAHFAELYDASPVGYAGLNDHGIIEEINSSGAKLLGFSRRQLSRHPLAIFIATSDRKRLQNYLSDIRRYDKRGSVELELARKHRGHPIFIELIAIPSVNAEKSKKFQCALVDITARRMAETALRESEAKFRTLTSHAPVGIFLCDDRGANTFVNESWCQMTGLSADKACGDGWTNAVHPDDRDRVARRWQEALRKGEPSKDEFRFLRPDGKIIWVHGSAVRLKDAEGKFVGYIGTVADITERKDSEFLIAESEKRYRNLIRSLPAAVYTTDANGRVQLFNEALIELLGQKPEIGRELWRGLCRMFNPDGSPCTPEECAMTATLETGIPARDREIIIERPDGTRRHVLPFPEPVFDAAGRIVGTVNMLVDITERKRVELALQRYAAIVESSDDAIVAKDTSGIINSWNQGAERIFGYQAEEIIGKPVLTLIPSERHAEETEILARIHRGQAVKHFETVRRRKDGKLIQVSLTISPVKSLDGKIIGASKIARDITERKMAEEQQRALYDLLASVNRAMELPEIYELALDTILKLQGADRAAILLSDADGAMRFKASRGLSSKYCAAVEGHSPWLPADPSPQPIFINDITAADLDANLKAIIDGEGIKALAFIPITYEKKLMGKFMIYYDSRHQFTSSEIRPAQTVASQIAFAIDRKRAEAQLKRATDEAERASRAKDDFLATLSHELRTPLNPVLLLASDAASNPELPPRVRTDFDTIRKNIELEARLIDDLLDLTRLSRGKFKLEKNVIDAHAVLQNAVATVRSEIEQKQISLGLELKADHAAVVADDVRLQQVFWNVLKNAVKFTPVGGKISVETQSRDGSLFVVRISDTGIGIDPEETNHIFDAFSQGAHSGFGGLGLGLAISRKLVEQHDGRIWADSDGKGRGATFTIELPLAQRPRSAAGQTSASGNAAASPNQMSRHINILLVEDHEPTRTALTHLLARRNHKVTAASSATEARSAVKRSAANFDLVISDIGLPDGSGYDLMAELRQHCGLKGIALTGYGMEQDVNRSLESGFVAHLTKPIRMENLENALGVALGRPA